MGVRVILVGDEMELDADGGWGLGAGAIVIRVGCCGACTIGVVGPAVENLGAVIVVWTGAAGVKIILAFDPGVELTGGDDTEAGAVVVGELRRPPEPAGCLKLNLPACCGGAPTPDPEIIGVVWPPV
jgi:hypothetical protein